MTDIITGAQEHVGSKQTFTSRGLGNVAKYSLFSGQVELQPSAIQTNAQQKHRFYLFVDGIPAAYIVNVDRPGYSIQTEEHLLLDYPLHFPVRVKWDPISFSIREVFSSRGSGDLFSPGFFSMESLQQTPIGSVASNMMAKLLGHSYVPPNRIPAAGSSTTATVLSAITRPMDTARDAIYGNKNLSKENLTKSLGEIKIVSLNGAGDVYESWTIHNGMITNLKFSQLGYGGEDLTEISVTVNYDWATYRFGGT